jgi:hypothetical protein
MRLPRFRLRTLMISIAFLALVLTVIMQAFLLSSAVVREQRLRAEADLQRALAEEAMQRALAETNYLRSMLGQVPK